MSNPESRQKPKWWQVALIVPFVPLLLALVVVAIPLYLAASLCLHIAIWIWWCVRGCDILFVYSDSPVWHDYIEQRIYPTLTSVPSFSIGRTAGVGGCHWHGWRSITLAATGSSIRWRWFFGLFAAHARFDSGSRSKISSMDTQRRSKEWRVSSLD